MARLIRLAMGLSGVLLFACLLPGHVYADGPPHGSGVNVGENEGRTSYTATITTNGRGVWIGVHARQTYAGQYAVPSGSSVSYAAYGSNPGSPYSQTGSAAGTG